MSVAEMIHREYKMKTIEVNFFDKTVSVLKNKNWETCNFYEAGLQPNGEFIEDADEVEEYFNEKYQDEELNITFIYLPSFFYIRNDIKKELQKIYSEPQNYNTDIIVEKDGTVRTHNYFGSVDYRDKDIVFVYKVEAYYTSEYKDVMRSNLTDEQIQYCDEKGWLTIYETKSSKKEDWEQFESSDDDFIDTLDQIEEFYNQAVEEYNSKQ